MQPNRIGWEQRIIDDLSDKRMTEAIRRIGKPRLNEAVVARLLQSVDERIIRRVAERCYILERKMDPDHRRVVQNPSCMRAEGCQRSARRGLNSRRQRSDSALAKQWDQLLRVQRVSF